MKVVGTNSKWEQDAQFYNVREGGISKEKSKNGRSFTFVKEHSVCSHCSQVVFCFKFFIIHIANRDFIFTILQ